VSARATVPGLDYWQFPAEKPDVPPNPQGWFSPENAAVLARLLNSATRQVIELGSWLGMSTRHIASCAPNATIFAVDHWLGSSEHIIEFRHLLENLYETFLVNCWEYRDRIVPCRADTSTGLIVLHHYNVSPDLIYIDASHDYESVRRDIKMCRQYFPSAQIVGDDWGWTSVRRAVIDELGENAIDATGNCWWIKSQ
jgi:hypothetical protein